MLLDAFCGGCGYVVKKKKIMITRLIASRTMRGDIINDKVLNFEM